MNLDNIFNEVLITEMARADLKGAGDALKNKDWTKVAKVYVKNTRARGMEDGKIVSGLGSTFRPKKGETTVTIGKTEDGEAITLSTDDVSAIKKAVKGAIGFTTKASQKKKSSEEKAKTKKQPKKDSEAKAPKKADIKKDDSGLTFLNKKSMEEGSALAEINRNIKYVDNQLRLDKRKIDKNEEIIKEAFKDDKLKTAIREMFNNSSLKKINEILKK